MCPSFGRCWRFASHQAITASLAPLTQWASGVEEAEPPANTFGTAASRTVGEAAAAAFHPAGVWTELNGSFRDSSPVDLHTCRDFLGPVPPPEYTLPSGYINPNATLTLHDTNVSCSPLYCTVSCLPLYCTVSCLPLYCDYGSENEG